MDTTNVRTVQIRIFKIFLEFERVCLEHNLRFYLVAGTLLGAVRHKGFIPWDDDMDVAMPRKDYEILLKHAHEWFKHPFALDCRENNENYPFRFAKAHDVTTTFYENKGPNYIGGIFIDIFPFDGLPDGKIRQKLHLWWNRILYKMYYFSFRDPYKYGKRWDSNFILLFHKLIPTNKAYQKLKRNSTQYDFETSNYVTDHDFGLRGIIEKKALGDEPAKVMFEGHETHGIRDWDYYLKTIYGDYMQLPPPEKRKSDHYVVYRDLDLPFAEYKKNKK
jgi:LPS biosynthesis protein